MGLTMIIHSNLSERKSLGRKILSNVKPPMRPGTTSPIIIEPLESENLSNMERRSGPDGFLSERFECIPKLIILKPISKSNDFLIEFFSLRKLLVYNKKNFKFCFY